MSNEEQLKYIPFHAINEFMRVDFRLNVIRSTFSRLNELDRKNTASIDKLIRRHVKVAGFRNSAKAPVTMKAVAAVKPFEKEPQFVAGILEAWSEINTDLKTMMFEILNDRGWNLLPLDANRTKLPGFLTLWPEEDDYEVLYEAFKKAYPENNISIDETSLMAVWLSGRLPIEKVSFSKISLSDSFADHEKQETKGL
jgi:hypothetical protein